MKNEDQNVPDNGVIDIIDLANPVLTDMQKMALEHAPEVPLDEESVLSAARDATGLTDFGDEGFRERLRLWLQCTRDDTALTRIGQAGIVQIAIRYATNRLRIEDLVRRHPEILEIEIAKPLVIAGLPRSGTTHLQNFLGADTRLRSLPYWEAVRPVPAPDEVARPGEDDPRRAKCAAEWAQQDALMPLMKSIHEFSPDHISEDVEFQGIDFGSYYPEWIIRAPAWRDYCEERDQTPIYEYLKKCLQVLDFLTGGEKRWLLKCPQHMEMLIPLTRVFPDATIIITHRDPVASIQSAITGPCYSARVTRTHVDPDEVAEYWIDRYERLLRACVRDRDLLDDARTVDVYFDRFMADEMSVLSEIYDKAGLALDDDVESKMDAFLEANPRGKHGRLVYNLRRDFGLTPEAVRSRFQFYLDRFPVPVEVK
jgi:Sulfotransferase family